MSDNIDHAFTLWTIYDHPRDFPDCFVARKYHIGGPTSHVIMRQSLEELRTMLCQMGFVRIPRDDNDDPVIVETWI